MISEIHKQRKFILRLIILCHLDLAISEKKDYLMVEIKEREIMNKKL